MSDWSEVDTAEFPLPSVREGFDRAREFSSRVRIDVSARSDTGTVRESNEDHYE